ncbi:MAG: hypothetical protein HYR60_03925 [Acidobacteria bacterium]|nr:hypothetical protein [Acidobacteriota bacterium]MBI3470193.1 hypothetical protein [Candidatus Solibacter usitatus]
MKLEIELDVPDEVVDQNFERAVREDAVLRLFTERKIQAERPSTGWNSGQPVLERLGIRLDTPVLDGWLRLGV